MENKKAAISHGMNKSMLQKRGRDASSGGEVAAELPADKRARSEGPDVAKVGWLEKVSVDYTRCIALHVGLPVSTVDLVNNHLEGQAPSVTPGE